MAEIDWDKPIRTVRSKRRLYVVGWRSNRHRLLDTVQGSSFDGFPYMKDGSPVDPDLPWGRIENFEDSPFEAVIDTQLEREREAFAEAMGDNELFGMF